MLLKKVIYIARHGPRVPIYKIPKLPEHRWEASEDESFESLITNASLTPKGAILCKQFGQKLKNLHFEQLELTPNDIKIYSSNIERTIHSAKYMLEGMFENKNIVPISIHKSLLGYNRFTKEQYIRFRQLMKHNKFDKDTKELREQIKEHFNIGIETTNTYFDINSTLKCYEFENISTDIPNELIKKIEECSNEYFRNVNSDKTMIQIFTTQILKLIDELINDADVKFAYLSTHDVIVFPLAYYLSNYSKINVPGFCEYVKYEVYDDCTKIYYNDMLIKVINQI